MWLQKLDDTPQHEEVSVTHPTGRSISYTCHQEASVTHSNISYTLKRSIRKVFFPSFSSNKPSQWKWLQFSKWETFTTLNSHFPPTDFHSKHPLPTSSFFPIKEHSSLLFVELIYTFCYRIFVQNWNTLLSPNKPILLINNWLF